MTACAADLISKIERGGIKEGGKSTFPSFRPGDGVKVHAKIIEGTKERIQVFQGVVIGRHHGEGPKATFTVRKISYNIGVERTFLLHSPRIEKIEVVSRGEVRRAKLYYLRDLKGKAGRIKSRLETALIVAQPEAAVSAPEVEAVETPAA